MPAGGPPESRALPAEDAYFGCALAPRVLIAWRSSVPYAALEHIAPSFDRLTDKALDGHGRVLLDVRDVAGRNDPAFEQAIKEPRSRLFLTAEKVVLLSQSPTGALQLRRHARESGAGHATVVHTEEDAAALLELTPEHFKALLALAKAATRPNAS